MSLDTVELVIEIEKSFDIEIKDQDAAQIETVGELIDHSWMLVSQSNSNDLYTKSSVEKTVKGVIQKISGLELAEIRNEASITNDLGLD